MKGKGRKPFADLMRQDASPLAVAAAEQDRQTLSMVKAARNKAVCGWLTSRW